MAAKEPAVRGRTRWLVGVLGATVLLLLIHLGVGSFSWYSPAEVLSTLLRGPHHDDTRTTIVWQIRLPRAVACALVGGLLGAVGSAFQAQLRNPLADPYIVGVSSGAAVGGVLAIVTGIGGWLGGLGTLACGFVGGILTLALVLVLSRRRGVLNVTSLLLAGVVVGSLLSSVLSLILLASGQDQVAVLGWLLGSITPAYWNENAILAGALGIGSFVLFRESRRLNAFALGEATAQRLGVDTARLTRIVLFTGTAMTAAAVGAVGIIGFLGLASPHIARRLLGVDWRWSLPGSMVIGMALLLASDLLAQRGVAALTGRGGIEIPVGIVTAILGAPSLLILMRRKDG